MYYLHKDQKKHQNNKYHHVHRIEFDREVSIDTDNACHILMLVEGSEITLVTADGTTVNCSYTETFVVPAAAGNYKLINRGEGQAKVVKAFVKNDFDILRQFKR